MGEMVSREQNLNLLKVFEVKHPNEFEAYYT